MRLRPLDEIRHDQKVAGVFHAGDDAEFERKPFAVIFDAVARRQRMPRQPLFEPGEGGAAQFFRLVRLICRSRRFRRLGLLVLPGFTVLGAGGEARQDRCQRPRSKGAAFGNLNARRQRLRQIGEQRRHFRAALEAMLGGELAALAFGDEPALGDAQQRIVGLVILAAGEERLVGGHERNAAGVSKLDQSRLRRAFGRHAVTLQFDIEAITKQPLQVFAARHDECALAGADRRVERTVDSATERNQSAGLAGEPVELKMRPFGLFSVEVGARAKPHQAAVAVLARG